MPVPIFVNLRQPKLMKNWKFQNTEHPNYFLKKYFWSKHFLSKENAFCYKKYPNLSTFLGDFLHCYGTV